MAEKYVDKKIAAKIIGVSVKTIERRIKDNTLPAYRVGHLIRIKESDVISMIENGRCNG